MKFDKAVKFPDGIVDILNRDKDAFLRMQVVKDGTNPEPLPETLPKKVASS